MQKTRTPSDLGDFFDLRWKVYRDLLDYDLMHHQHLFSLLGERVKTSLPDNYHFLDLACGDSDPASKLLARHPAAAYVGVDLARAVLTLAEANLKTTSTPFHLVDQDFVEYLRKTERQFDLALLSFSLHHLETSLKEEFFQLARTRIAPGGFLAVIDGMRLTGQTREHWLELCYRYMETRSQGRCQHSCQTAHAHMIESDFPEEAIHYVRMATDAGFEEVELIHHDQKSSFGLLIARVGKNRE